MTNMFSAEAEELTIDAVKEKYSNDPDKAWEALLHSQNHIKKIETENTTFKTKLAKETTLEEVLAALRDNQNSQTPPSLPTPNGTGEPKEPDFEKMFNEFTRKRQQEQEESRNQDLIIAAFKDKFKDKASEQFSTVAKDAGFSVEDFETLAKKNPKAVLRLAGLDQSTGAPGRTPSVNPQALQAVKGAKGQPGTKSYYDNIRKENKSLYESSRIQNQMIADFDRDPEFFMNN